MNQISPIYSTSEQGKDIVILNQADYQMLIDELNDLREELEDIRDFDDAIAKDDGKRYKIEEVFDQ